MAIGEGAASVTVYGPGIGLFLLGVEVCRKRSLVSDLGRALELSRSWRRTRGRQAGYRPARL